VPVRVVDASALVELTLETELGSRVAATLRDAALAVPAHADADVLSAVGRLVRAREVSATRAERALTLLARAPLHRYVVHPLFETAWRLRNSVSLRDATYVALAYRLSASLVTTDAALSRAPAVDVTLTLVR
jgi:predicted nucleic acid-binding protein